MPFEFRPYQSNLQGTIAELMGRDAQIRARAARESGDAQSRALEIKGQSRANLYGAVGQAANQTIGTIGNILQQRREAPAREQDAQMARHERILKIKEIEDRLAKNQADERDAQIAKQAYLGAVKQATTQGEDGGQATDWSRVAEDLQRGGWTQMASTVLQQAKTQKELTTPEPTPALIQRDPTRDLVNPQTGAVVTPGTPEAPKVTFGQPQVQMVGGQRALVRPGNDGQMYDTRGQAIPPELLQPLPERPRAETTVNVGGDPQGAAAPLDPASQDLMSHAGLTYNGFLAVTGRMSQLPRDKETRNRASAEVAAWARERGMDISTLTSQYKAYNEALESNIARYNRTLLAEGEIAADIENLLTSVKESGLGDARAINAAKQWLKGELNDPNAAQYAFFLNQLTNDIALYNAASQGRATLQADLEDAKSVVQRGIAAGSLAGMQKAITQSVEKMGTVLEGAVNRSRKNVWDLFGVGDKYTPSGTKPRGAAPPTTAPMKIGDYEVTVTP